MKMRKYLMIAAAIAAPTFAVPASAQSDYQWELMDAAYEQCVSSYYSHGYTDSNFIESTCYAQVYGNEGGGNPTTPGSPGGSDGNWCFFHTDCPPPHTQPN